jgi:hypothetical protein
MRKQDDGARTIRQTQVALQRYATSLYANRPILDRQPFKSGHVGLIECSAQTVKG